MTTIVDDLQRAVSQHQDKPALVHGDNSLSYSELWTLAEKVATLLRQQGLERGGRVVLIIENSPEYAALYYGVLLAGGVVVALNTAAKEDELNNWIAHAGATFGFAKPAVLNCKSSEPAKIFLIRRIDEGTQLIVSLDKISSMDIHLQSCEINENDLAAIIYTSGTTGEPKGVMLSHKNLAANMASIREYLPIEADDRVLNVLPFYYSYGNSVLHTNLGVGATIVMENSMMFPAKVVESMQNHEVTAFYGVASTYAILLSRAKLENYNLSSMRYVTQAGGPMPPAHIEQIMCAIPQSKFFMMYGQTEATARLGYIPAELINKKLGSAGKAIPGVELEIRDNNGHPVPYGTEGEIYAKGENIMQGYWKNPEMTQEILNTGWLRTGDIAKMDEDGYIYMTGRRTDMIKSGANRISPKEIEEKLAELEDIEESAAIGIRDDILGQAIKVYIVKKEGSDILKQTVMKHCKKNLAPYKIPKEVEFIEQLPKTASGKLQRFKLIER